MKSKALKIVSIAILVVLILVLGMLAAGAIAKSNMAKQYPAPGQLVDVGEYKMHIHCTGQGSPTVILEAGLGDFSLIWSQVQPEVARFTRVCSYDRAGYGWSGPSPYPLTTSRMAGELHTLLVNANIQGPYVLVGHSLGGLIARIYAHTYPGEVAGIVLVDSTHEEQYIRLAAAVPKFQEILNRGNEQAVNQYRLFGILSSTGLMALVPQSIPNPAGFQEAVFEKYRANWATTHFFDTIVMERESLEGILAEARALHITSFDLPLIVIHVKPSGMGPEFTDVENQQLIEVQRILQSDLAALSSDSELIVAEHSSHCIQCDQPDLVINAAREMLERLRE